MPMLYDCGYKDGAIQGYDLAQNEFKPLLKAVEETLHGNTHLADSDDCTLRMLRAAFEDYKTQYKCKS